MQKLLIILLLTLVTTGCVSHNAIQQPDLSNSLDAQNSMVSQNGIDLMVKPIHSKQELGDYFDYDLVKHHILPVQIYVKNNSDERYFFNTESVRLQTSSHQEYPQLPTAKVVEKAKRSYAATAGWTVALGLIGASISAVNVASTNKKIENDYYSRVLHSGHMAKGASTEGILFFDVPEQLQTLDDLEIQVALSTRHSAEPQTIAYALTGNVEKRETPEFEDDDPANTMIGGASPAKENTAPPDSTAKTSLASTDRTPVDPFADDDPANTMIGGFTSPAPEKTAKKINEE